MSRGLGDVYKRQGDHRHPRLVPEINGKVFIALSIGMKFTVVNFLELLFIILRAFPHIFIICLVIVLSEVNVEFYYILLLHSLTYSSINLLV